MMRLRSHALLTTHTPLALLGALAACAGCIRPRVGRGGAIMTSMLQRGESVKGYVAILQKGLLLILLEVPSSRAPITLTGRHHDIDALVSLSATPCPHLLPHAG